MSKLIARHITHHFYNAKGALRVLDDLSLSLNHNEFGTIVGTSGCGKSTFLNMVAGLLQPESGELLLDGEPITAPGRDRGLVFQSYTLFPWKTVRQNVLFALKKSHMPRKAKLELADYYINKVGLSGFEDAYPSELSGGMKQRVAIARALVYNPSMLLMDEPFGALDAQTRGLMQELLVRVWEEQQTTVLFITHDVEEAVFLSDRVFVFTARPGSVKRVIDIPIEHPRSYETTTTPEFNQLKREVVETIRAETLKALGAY